MYVIRRRGKDGFDTPATYQDASGAFQGDIEKARQHNTIESAMEALNALGANACAYYDICVFASPETAKRTAAWTPLSPREIRRLTGMSQKGFADVYGIPLRTVTNWEQEIRTPPEWTLRLLERCVRDDLKNGRL